MILGATCFCFCPFHIRLCPHRYKVKVMKVRIKDIKGHSLLHVHMSYSFYMAKLLRELFIFNGMEGQRQQIKPVMECQLKFPTSRWIFQVPLA